MIQYPAQNEWAKRYTIVDTPGPDFAGANHKEAAYKWIEQADVILFVVDYAKHLTAYEEQYLRDIKKQFERSGKFYSLLIVVNKLDEMYRSQEVKSGIRFLDYLRARLHDLGYQGFTVMGVSALTYLLSVQAPKIPGCERLVSNDQRELQNAFRDCRALYRGKPEMTSISFLRSQMDNLLDFFGIEATLHIIQEKSNMPRLIQYTDYIARQKAGVETYKHHLFEIDMLSAQLKNKLQQDRIDSLYQHKGTMQETHSLIAFKMQEMASYMQEMEVTVVEKALIENVRKTYAKILEESEGKLLIEVDKEISTQIQRFLTGLSAWRADELQERIQDDAFLRDEILPLLKLDEIGRMSEAFYGKQLQMIQKRVEEQLKRKEADLQQSVAAFLSRVQELSVFIKKEYVTEDVQIAVPALEPVFYTPFIMADAAILLEPKVIAEKIENHIVEKGFFKRLLSLLLFKREKHDLQADSLVSDLQDEIKEHTAKKLKELHSGVLSHLDGQFKQLQQKMYEEVQEVLRSYKLLFSSIHQDMFAEQERVLQTIEGVEQQMELAKYLEENLAAYFSCWNEILTGEPEVIEEPEDASAEEMLVPSS